MTSDATATWASALMHALARDEAAGRKPARLTEPGLGTWSRFRGRLGAADLVRLLFDDGPCCIPCPRSGLGRWAAANPPKGARFIAPMGVMMEDR